ncbi:hypothetical protein AKJ16_DCAP22832 [Drosera capensis]
MFHAPRLLVLLIEIDGVRMTRGIQLAVVLEIGFRSCCCLDLDGSFVAYMVTPRWEDTCSSSRHWITNSVTKQAKLRCSCVVLVQQEVGRHMKHQKLLLRYTCWSQSVKAITTGFCKDTIAIGM